MRAGAELVMTYEAYLLPPAPGGAPADAPPGAAAPAGTPAAAQADAPAGVPANPPQGGAGGNVEPAGPIPAPLVDADDDDGAPPAAAARASDRLPSFFPGTGATAAAKEILKRKSYANRFVLAADRKFIPCGIEAFGALGPAAIGLIQDIATRLAFLDSPGGVIPKMNENGRYGAPPPPKYPYFATAVHEQIFSALARGFHGAADSFYHAELRKRGWTNPWSRGNGLQEM